MASQGLNIEKPGEVIFIVGEHKVRCHALKGLLAISSPIFRKIFAENKENEIELPDIDAEGFQIALEYVNGNDVKKKINQRNMCNLLYVSRKYVLPKLVQTATKYVRKSLNKSNIFELYILAESLNDDNLKEILWRWLGRKSLKTTDPIIGQIFETLNAKQISTLLQSDYISIEEERIFIHCLNWLKLQYQKQTTKELYTAREMCDEFILFIRFPLMSSKFLSTDVYNTGILTNDELLDILRAKTLKDQQLTMYSLSKRYGASKRRQGDLSDTDDDEMEEEEEKLDESDNDFDSVNLAGDKSDDEDNTENDENIQEIEITSKIKPVSCSSQYSNAYGMNNMFQDNTNYWCTTSLTSSHDAYIIFDCGKYVISKVDIKFPPEEGACSIVKVFSTDNKRNLRNTKLSNWDKITRKINMPKDGNVVETIKIRNEDVSRYLLLNFEDGMNGYAGIERIRFFALKE